MKAELLFDPPKEKKEDGNKRNDYREIICNTLIGTIKVNVQRSGKGTSNPFFEEGLNYLVSIYERIRSLFYVIGVPTHYVGKLFKQPGLKQVDKFAVSRQNKKELDPLPEAFCTRSFAGQY